MGARPFIDVPGILRGNRGGIVLRWKHDCLPEEAFSARRHVGDICLTAVLIRRSRPNSTGAMFRD
ncbi:hypothetical protein RSSM_06340 [Rhodopirellula sallentina SM41]|uniref:Uncharacterized protein n=1 Tax=Rhodopirellula sallentina SM41 TaxID=1263870 RepID=M5U307_9BACT|nr:hypothetical protein RSSM_06340 [Rhodopirellula sallentina SM41]